MDMPTTCPTCSEVVEFSDMIDLSESGGSDFVCEECATDAGYYDD